MAIGDNIKKLDAEWIGLTAVRDVLSTAARVPKSYDDAIRFSERLAPDMYSPGKSLIAAAHEPLEIQRVRDIASARTALLGREVTPLEVVDDEIAEYKKLLTAKTKRTKGLSRNLRALQSVKARLVEKPFTEGAVIRRDVFTARHINWPVPAVPGPDYVEYEIGRNRAFRVRMLHPDQPEQITGADVIYDLCDEKSDTARVAFLQYKIWEDDTLYFSSAGNLCDQLAKLDNFVCRKDLCQLDSNPPFPSYRMPHCAAFLRPTDRLQRADARLMSSGEHLPICMLKRVLGVAPSRSSILRRSNLLGSSVTQGTFGELFARGMLGSRKISISELETMYRNAKLLNPDEVLFIHAQEVAYAS